MSTEPVRIQKPIQEWFRIQRWIRQSDRICGLPSPTTRIQDYLQTMSPPPDSLHSAGVLPEVAEYVDYRAFLSAWFAAKKEQNPRYSHRLFARQAGYTNPSLLGLIIKGERNLTDALLPGFMKALGLDRETRATFRLLVDLDRARSLADRAHLIERLAARRRFEGALRLEDQGFAYLSRWTLPAIRELAGRDDFRLDADWVAARLRPRAKRAEVQEALDRLVEMGMLVPDADGGATQTEQSVVTAHEVASVAVRRYHQVMGELAVAELEHKGGSERHFGAVTVLVPPALVPTLKSEIAAFQERMLALCDDSEDPGEVAMQLNLQLFPLSQEPTK